MIRCCAIWGWSREGRRAGLKSGLGRINRAIMPVLRRSLWRGTMRMIKIDREWFFFLSALSLGWGSRYTFAFGLGASGLGLMGRANGYGTSGETDMLSIDFPPDDCIRQYPYFTFYRIWDLYCFSLDHTREPGFKCAGLIWTHTHCSKHLSVYPTDTDLSIAMDRVRIHDGVINRV